MPTNLNDCSGLPGIMHGNGSKLRQEGVRRKRTPEKAVLIDKFISIKIIFLIRVQRRENTIHQKLKSRESREPESRARKKHPHSRGCLIEKV